MANTNDTITYIPYRQKDEPPRKAALNKVDFSLDGFTDDEIQVLGHLMEAAELMNPIFRDQFEPRTFKLIDLVANMINVAEGETLEKLNNYAVMLDLQNSPYALLPRKNHILDIPEEELKKLAAVAGGDTPELFAEVGNLLTEGIDTPDKANYYPDDLTDTEYESLGDRSTIVNSSVVRDNWGVPVVLLNEDRYKETLAPIIEHIKAARDLTKDLGFRLYLDAKILELEVGTEEARRLADYTWVRHDSKIDIVISTALEVYLDNYKNARGSATGGVYVKNEAASELLTALVSRVPYWETNAPWDNKKTEIDPETLPKLKFVDVLSWSGDYVTGPFTTIAQSLPNDEWVIQNVGTVNMVYMNTGKSVHAVAGNLAAGEFLLKSEFETVKDLIFEANQLHSALHEIGHTTGIMDPEHRSGQARDYLEEEYSFLEEARAELFGLWSLAKLVEDGVIPAEKARACYDGMLITMITSLKFDPVQAHNKARNGMFHYFKEKGIINRTEEGGEIRYSIDHNKAHAVVSEMLALVANIKASGDKQGAIDLREKYVYADELKAEVERRTQNFPLGRGLIFPRLKKDGDTYLPELEYTSFSDQPKFEYEL